MQVTSDLHPQHCDREAHMEKADSGKKDEQNFWRGGIVLF